MEKLGTKTFLIIIGAARCGTTSLFHYFSHHPDIESSRVKMTGFFLDKDYPKGYIPGKNKYNEENPEDYLLFFQNQKKGMFIEASPDYLYDEKAALKIKSFKNKTGANVVLLCLLRNPVDRFISAYHNLRKLSLIESNVSLKECIKHQSKDYHSPLESSALWMGKYQERLLPYQQLFSEEEIVYIKYEDLVNQPRVIVSKVLSKLGLSDSCYQQYTFEKHNSTSLAPPTKMQRNYLKIRKWIVAKTINYPQLFGGFKMIGKRLSKQIFENQKDSAIEPYKEERKLLTSLYEEELENMEKIDFI